VVTDVHHMAGTPFPIESAAGSFDSPVCVAGGTHLAGSRRRGSFGIVGGPTKGAEQPPLHLTPLPSVGTAERDDFALPSTLARPAAQSAGSFGDRAGGEQVRPPSILACSTGPPPPPRHDYWATVLGDNCSRRPSIIGGIVGKALLRPSLGIQKPSTAPLLLVRPRPPADTGVASDNVSCATMSTAPPSPHRDSSVRTPSATTSAGGDIKVKSFSCRDCKLRFSTRLEQMQHAAACPSRTTDRPFACTHCGASFHKNSNLLKHIALVELKLRPYECTLCDAKFGQKSNLSSHIRVTHHGERRYACTERGCDRRFGQNSGLRAHVKTVHLGARDYVCECARKFGSRGDLNRHIRSTHQKLLPFSCAACGKAFSRKSVLLRHSAAVHAAAS
jgi:hypothetical protein